MICEPCQAGGAANRTFNAVPLPPASVVKLYLQSIGEWHAKCKGGTWCDCQHVAGQGINKQLVRQA